MIVAVDIGNTSLHLKAADGAKKRFSSLQSDGPRDAAAWLSGQPDPICVWIASVCRPMRKLLEESLAATSVQTRVITHVDVPMQHDVDRIERVGIDRLLAAWRSMQIVNGDCIVIDSGSAITADVVVGGAFRGGVILPGLAMQTRALAGGADRLYEIDFETPDIAIPGRNTTDAMAGGILTSVVAGLDRIVAQYRDQFGSELPVVGTGGDVMFLHDRLETPIRIEADLVCDGLLDLPIRCGSVRDGKDVDRGGNPVDSKGANIDGDKLLHRSGRE